MMFASTIAAVSTPPGKGGVAVIRISGADAVAIGKRIFRGKGKVSFTERARTQIYGDMLYRGEVVDDGLITYFPAPASYTGEDTVEISCHGGMLISHTVLESALLEGAQPSAPGEFTKRAFLSGKISLTDAEAIGAVLEAESLSQIMLARPKSRTRLTEATEKIRRSLTSLLSSIYARIDYPEEDLGDFTDEETVKEIDSILSLLNSLIDTYRVGKAVNEGISTVICGKPNVGKSTLYNLLCGFDAAIVTDIPGTTRDVLEKKISLGNVMLLLSDTAGIRVGASDAVEEIGINRSRERIDSSELILALFDSSRPQDAEDDDVIECIKDSRAAVIAIITKCDQGGFLEQVREQARNLRCDAVIEISCTASGADAIGAVRDAVERLFVDEKISIGTDGRIP